MGQEFVLQAEPASCRMKYYVDTSEEFPGLLDCRLDFFRYQKVNWNTQVLPGLAARVANVIEVFPGTGKQRYSSTTFGKGNSRNCTQASRGACDYDPLVFHGNRPTTSALTRRGTSEWASRLALRGPEPLAC